LTSAFENVKIKKTEYTEIEERIWLLCCFRLTEADESNKKAKSPKEYAPVAYLPG